MAADVLGAHYTTVFNQAERDRQLSRRARGLLVELLGHRDGYGISLAMLVKAGTEGKDALSAPRELETHGYLHRERQRDARGRLEETRYYLTDMPQGAEIIAQAPWGTSGPPAAGAHSRRSEPEPENPPQAEPDQSTWSEPKSGFPVQACPAQADPPHKKTNRKKTTKQNPNSLPPSGQTDSHASRGAAHVIHDLAGLGTTVIDRAVLAVSLQASLSALVFVLAVALITSAATGMRTNTQHANEAEHDETA
ncbi:hypothetical protein ACYBSK_19090 [Streptomyces sp. BYX5S]